MNNDESDISEEVKLLNRVKEFRISKDFSILRYKKRENKRVLKGDN
jgi:hypothetical protein